MMGFIDRSLDSTLVRSSHRLLPLRLHSKRFDLLQRLFTQGRVDFLKEFLGHNFGHFPWGTAVQSGRILLQVLVENWHRGRPLSEHLAVDIQFWAEVFVFVLVENDCEFLSLDDVAL